MNHRIYRSSKEPKREGLSADELWKGDDNGLMIAWEVGREMRNKDPKLAECAEKGELPILDFKGGVRKATKNKEKYGTYYYLAQWQGLRGEDLDIDLSQELELICARTGIRVTYTGDVQKYGSADE